MCRLYRRKYHDKGHTSRHMTPFAPGPFRYRAFIVSPCDADEALRIAARSCDFAERWMRLAALSPAPAQFLDCAAARLDLARRLVDAAVNMGVAEKGKAR